MSFPFLDRIARTLVVGLGLTGCVIPDAYDETCEDGCVAPLTCERDDWSGEARCMDVTLSDCVGSPAGLEVPFQTTESTNRPLRWALTGDCVATSYDTSASDMAEMFTTAVGAWSDVTCSQLCLLPPVLDDSVADTVSGERRIHLQRSVFMEMPTQQALTTVWHDRETGHIRSVQIEVATETDQPPSVSSLLHFLGAALGLGNVLGDVDTVMVPWPFGNTVHDAPSSLDESTLCVMYGDAPYCTY